MIDENLVQKLTIEQRRLFKLVDDRFEKLCETIGSEIYCGHDYLRGSVYDGCLDVQRYFEASTRIMWILKEHNGEPKSYGQHWVAFADCLYNPKDPLAIDGFRKNVRLFRSLRLIERASRLFLHLQGTDPVDVFKAISILNLGKCPGEKKTPDKRIGKLLGWWGDIVQKQIEVYEPNLIIVAGNHFSRLSQYLGITKGGQSFSQGKAKSVLYDYKGIPFIKMQHPSWYGCLEDDWISVLKNSVVAMSIS